MSDVLFWFGIALIPLSLSVVLWVAKVWRRSKSFAEHVDDAMDLFGDERSERIDMEQWERDAEVEWLRQLYGPPIIPGRSDG